MTDRIALKDLQNAINNATKHAGLIDEKLIIGFIAPDVIEHSVAQKVAEDITKASGLHGTPTVSPVNAGQLAEHAAAHATPTKLPGGHIIIGLIAREL